MSKNILVSGPALSLSGYGQQTRFALKSLKEYTDHNIYINCTNWGKTAWIGEEYEMKPWIDKRIEETRVYSANQDGQFDLSIQVTIPNEIEKQAPLNICYTAGIEVDEVSPHWIQNVNNVADKVILVSDWAKEVFENTSYDLENDQGQVVQPNFRAEVPMDAVHFPHRKIEDPVGLDLDLDYDFNFLSIFQWTERKNIENMVRWFVEEFYDQEVGLVLKGNHMNNSLIDYRRTKKRINGILDDYDEDRECAVHLLHGELTEDEILSLYHHKNIRAYVSTTHGECFGLPLFEAACAGVPVVATDWSGHTDYLYKGDEPLFSNIPYELKEISEEAVWDGVLQRGTKWAYPKQGPFKMAMRDVVKNYPKHKSRANKLKKHLRKEHSDTYEDFAESVNELMGYSQFTVDPPEPEEVSGVSFCIITNGERPEKIELELDSIHETMSNTDMDYEIIVSGDTSDLELHNIKEVEKPELANTGKVAALRNEAAKRANYDAIVFGDDDLVYPEEWASRLKRYSEENGWNVLGNKVLLPDKGRYWDKATYKPHKMINYDEYRENQYQCSCHFVVRKEVFDKHKWDSSIKFYAENEGGEVNEDVEYSQRLQENGYHILFDKENLVWHNDKSYIDIGELCVDRSEYCERLGLDMEDFEMDECEEFKNLVEEVRNG